MSGAEVFSCALLLRASDREDQILNLLEEGKREEVRITLESLKRLPAEAIRQLWRERRRAEDLPVVTGA